MLARIQRGYHGVQRLLPGFVQLAQHLAQLPRLRVHQVLEFCQLQPVALLLAEGRQSAVNRASEFIQTEWFENVIQRARFHCTHRAGYIVAGGEHHHTDIVLTGTDMLQKF